MSLSLIDRHLHHHQSPRAYYRILALHRGVVKHRYRLSDSRRALLGRLYLAYDTACYLKDQSLLQVPHWFCTLPQQRVRHLASGKLLLAASPPARPGTVVRGFLELMPQSRLATVRVRWNAPAATRRLVARHLERHTPALTLHRVARQPGVATLVLVDGPRRDRDRLLFSPGHALWHPFYQQPPAERFVVLHVDDPPEVQLAHALGCPRDRVWALAPGVWTVATRKAPDPALITVASRALGVAIHV